jgi:hypothetical protein
MENLGKNPTGGSGIFQGSSGARPDYETPLNIVNQLKDREMIDYKNKALFDADLNARQGMRMRSLFDPEGARQQQNQGQPNTQGMNTVMARDPNEMTGYQKGELGIRQQENNLESQRLNQTGKMGQQSLDIRDAQQKLNQEKSNQIDELKKNDLQRKIDESNKKLELAQKALEQKGMSAEAALQAHKDLATAMEERHKLELENKQHQFDITSKQHQDQIDALNKKIEQRADTQTTTELNPDGTKKTVTTKRGAGAKTVTVKGKDGKPYQIPADKVDDWNANHAGQ